MKESTAILCFVTAAVTLSPSSGLRAQDCDPLETSKLLAADGAVSDNFGHSVSVSGDTAVVGAYRDDDRGNDSGSAYVFEKVDNVWTQIAKLLASDGAPDDFFGYSVSVSGDTAVVGAYDDDDHGDGSGSAYVFEKVDNVWAQRAKLLASDGAPGDRFGFSVSVSGDTAVAGARFDDDHGSAYVFEKVDNIWTQTAKLLASDGAPGDSFGWSVSVSGDTAVVGARLDDDRGDGSGSAYVFEKVDNVWTQRAKLLASDGAVDDRFGRSVSVSGDTAVVGVYRDDDNGDASGSAYVFEKVDNVWTQMAKLLASDGAAGDSFGISVSVTGDTALVGAPGDNDLGGDSGSAYVFDLQCPDAACLDLAVENLIAGQRATFTITTGTPGAKAITIYGTKPGQVSINDYAGYCATFGIKGVNQNKIIGGLNRTFDANGEITFGVNVPGGLSGLEVLFQSAQKGTCPEECMSNLVNAVVQ